MICSDPVLKWDKKYRNWSLATPVFKASAREVFNCGKCLACRKNQSQQLAMRSVLSASLYQHNSFLTLTYDETKQGYHNEPSYPDIQKFKKRFRRYVKNKFGEKIQIFNVMEYGKNGKKHWHLLVFGFAFQYDRTLFTVQSSHPLYISGTLTRLWGHGHCTIGDISLGSALYQAQYTQKDLKNRAPNGRKAHSRHSGLARDYFFKNYKQILTLGYVPFDGRKSAIPRYFLKLAHKHYAHFYDRTYFFDSVRRKTKYKFLCATANKEIADLYKIFLEKRLEHIQDKSEKWEADVREYIYTNKKPDFVKSGENASYDLNNKQTREIF